MTSPFEKHGIHEIAARFQKHASNAMPANLRGQFQTLVIASLPVGDSTAVAHSYNGCACEGCREVYLAAINRLFDELQAGGAQVMQ